MTKAKKKQWKRKVKFDAAGLVDQVRQLSNKQIDEFVELFRRRLPDERPSVIHKFNVGGYEGYLIVGLFEDMTPGEIFIKMAKAGGTMSGIFDGFALSISLNLQYGVPLKKLIEKYKGTKFEPSGYIGTTMPGVAAYDWPASTPPKVATSVLDYIFEWLEIRFIKGEHTSKAPA